jgi:hypothetical protein
MSKPVRTAAELITMAQVLRDGDSWEFRAAADPETVAKPGYPECVAMLVQIGDHLSKQYDLSD